MATKRKPKKEKVAEELAVKPVQVKQSKPRKPKTVKPTETVSIVEEIIEPIVEQVVEEAVNEVVPSKYNPKKIAVLITGGIIAGGVYGFDYLISLIK
jgi:hypothetical protein